MCFLIIETRGQGFIEIFFEESKKEVRLAVIGLKSGSYGGLRAFLLTAELNFFSVALRKVMTCWDLNRKWLLSA